MNNLQKGIM